VKLVCSIKRPKGTPVEMPDDRTTYWFLPNEHGDHVASVENPAHIKLLLGIDVYSIYEGPQVAAPAAPASAEPEADVAINAAIATDLTNMTLEELQAEYHHRYGRVAPKLIKYDTLLRKLAEARSEDTDQE
jgi:hypothetical protein